VSVVCSGIAVGGSYTVGLGAGNYGPGDRVSTRYLNNSVNGGDPMAVNLYTEASYTTVWGSGALVHCWLAAFLPATAIRPIRCTAECPRAKPR